MPGKGVFCQEIMTLSSFSNLHTSICRHVHLHSRNNIVLLMSFVLGPGQHLCQCKYVDKYLLDSTGAFKPLSQRLYSYLAPPVGNYSLDGMHRNKYFTVVTAWRNHVLFFELSVTFHSLTTIGSIVCIKSRASP